MNKRYGHLFYLIQVLFMLVNKNRLDFIVIGAQKAGTTALDFYLRSHPQIQMSKKKEVHFFDNDDLFEGSKDNYKFYHQFFDFSIKNKIRGEITPSYMYWEPSVERIKAYNPNIKLISILRNPVERAFSHYNMEIHRNFEDRSFKICIQEEKKNNFDVQNKIKSYVSRGFYSRQIERVYRYFDKENILFIKYEDFLNNQYEELKKIFTFLGIENEMYNYQFKNIHATSYKIKLNELTKKDLINLYLNDVEIVEELLCWDCTDWKK